MKRIVTTAAILAVFLAPIAALASPGINGASSHPRVYNDCPISVLTFTNNYPAQIFIHDTNPACFGFANLHNWRLSDNGGGSPATFVNDDAFSFCTNLVIAGSQTGVAEAGLQVAPWWSQTDGRLNVKVWPGDANDGEIAAFGGRLPFYSFTGNYGIRYVAGTPIFLRITYQPNGLSQANPATIVYDVTYASISYSSGPLPFDQGNPTEDPPHGQWGILQPTEVGGYFQYMVGPSGTGTEMSADFRDICYEDLSVIPTVTTTWGKVKSLYR